MANSCVTYAEALKLHPPISKAYADTLMSPPPLRDTSSTNIMTKYSSSHAYSNTNSYKKTVFLKPKSPTKPDKGYNVATHQPLIRDCNTPFAPSQNILSNSQNPSLDNLSVKELIIALIHSLSQSNSLASPSNAAMPVKDIVSYINLHDGSIRSSDPVELPQHPK